MRARGKLDLVGHVNIPAAQLARDIPVNNVIINSATYRGLWIEESTKSIGAWRATFRSTYMRWALAINGLFVASEKYSSSEWQSQKQFTISSLRKNSSGEVVETAIAQWDGKTAATNHRDTQPMLVAYGIIDIYACIETWIFALYRMFLSNNPTTILRGDQFKELRQLRAKAQSAPSLSDEWKGKLVARLDAWQMKRAYDGLHEVFIAYFHETKLKRPKSYSITDVPDWAHTIRLIAVVRNLLIHGEECANDELGSLCGPNTHSTGFDFKSGEALTLHLPHLQAVEFFLEQLLSTVNMSLVEHSDAGK